MFSTVYRKTKTQPLLLSIIKRRWNLVEKVLNMNEKSPALFWMKDYFNCNLKKYKGRSNMALAICLKKDLEKSNSNLENDVFVQFVLKMHLFIKILVVYLMDMNFYYLLVLFVQKIIILY